MEWLQTRRTMSVSRSPLLAPPAGQQWAILWSSEDPRYGGLGTPPLDTTEGWKIPGHAAVVLQPELIPKSIEFELEPKAATSDVP